MTVSDTSIIGAAKVNTGVQKEYITDNNVKLLVVLLASAQRGRRESPSHSAVCPFTVFFSICEDSHTNKLQML